MSVETVQYSFWLIQSSSTLAGTPFSVLKQAKPTNTSVVSVKERMRERSVMNTMSKNAQKLRHNSIEFVKWRIVKAREMTSLGKGLRTRKTLSTSGLIRQRPRLHRKEGPQVARQAT